VFKQKINDDVRLERFSATRRNAQLQQGLHILP
jgi:hypothetical protein